MLVSEFVNSLSDEELRDFSFSDSHDVVKAYFEQNGYREAAPDEAADLCVVNTCTVTAEADSKARQIIR